MKDCLNGLKIYWDGLKAIATFTVPFHTKIGRLFDRIMNSKACRGMDNPLGALMICFAMIYMATPYASIIFGGFLLLDQQFLWGLVAIIAGAWVAAGFVTYVHEVDDT